HFPKTPSSDAIEDIDRRRRGLISRRTSVDCFRTAGSDLCGPQREGDRGTVVHSGVYPDPAAVMLDDALGDREPDPGARVCLARVEPLEDHEHLVRELPLDADSVVTKDDAPLIAPTLGGDPDLHRNVRAPELDRIADQVPEQRYEQWLLALNRRQIGRVH